MAIRIWAAITLKFLLTETLHLTPISTEQEPLVFKDQPQEQQWGSEMPKQARSSFQTQISLISIVVGAILSSDIME